MNKLIAAIAFVAIAGLHTATQADPNTGSGTPYEPVRDGIAVWHRGGVECHINTGDRVRVREWSHNDTRARVQVIDRDCSGDVHSNEIRRVGANATLYLHTIFTLDKWGAPHNTDAVPVFRSRSEFFKARGLLKGNTPMEVYLQMYDSVECIVRKGQRVIFEPFQDWGVGEIKAVKGKPDCKGWIDRSVVR